MFDLEDLHGLDDGALTTRFRHEALKAARDVIDRPTIDKPRTVVMKVHFIPVTVDGHLRQCAIEGEIVPVKVPNYVTFPQSAHVTMNGFELIETEQAIKQQMDPDEA